MKCHVLNRRALMKGLLICSFNSCETLAGLMVPANLDTHKSMAAVMEANGDFKHLFYSHTARFHMDTSYRNADNIAGIGAAFYAYFPSDSHYGVKEG